MSRLHDELQRLYLVAPPDPAGADPRSSALIDSRGRVRAMVLEIARPSDWALLSIVWLGVQNELDLPAPGIAVSGTDGLQLWFSLAEPIGAPQAHAFLDRLRQRFLPDVDPRRVRLLPAADASDQRPDGLARLVPALQETGNWSAFVAPGLAPVFAETPWLDIAPNDEGQASLLAGLEVAEPAAFAAALGTLGAAAQEPPAAVMPQRSGAPVAAAPACGEAEQFLLRVLRDDSVDLALRIEAARALLQQPGRQPA